MTMYRKKIVEVDAVFWDGSNVEECIEFLGDSYTRHQRERHPGGANNIVYCSYQTAPAGTWLLRNEFSQISHVSNAVFCEQYEAI